jgi:hypothetical protein
VLAPKAVVGEYSGAALAAAVLAAAGTPFGPTPGFREADPELGVSPHDGSSLAPPRCVLTGALAAGGAAAWAVLTAAAADLHFDEARDAGIDVPSAAVDRAVTQLTRDELSELGRLLQSELKGSSN